MGFFVYFISSVIGRDKKNWKYIIIFNLLTAWTVIGWFISFF
ncbi:superinfection immunity protein [uncultured Flavobacterium sp.]